MREKVLLPLFWATLFLVPFVDATDKITTMPVDSTYCIQDVKRCPDGSYVGRSPPSCDFEQCPTPTPLPEIRMNASVVSSGSAGSGTAISVRITPTPYAATGISNPTGNPVAQSPTMRRVDTIGETTLVAPPGWKNTTAPTREGFDVQQSTRVTTKAVPGEAVIAPLPGTERTDASSRQTDSSSETRTTRTSSAPGSRAEDPVSDFPYYGPIPEGMAICGDVLLTHEECEELLPWMKLSAAEKRRTPVPVEKAARLRDEYLDDYTFALLEWEELPLDKKKTTPYPHASVSYRGEEIDPRTYIKILEWESLPFEKRKLVPIPHPNVPMDWVNAIPINGGIREVAPQESGGGKADNAMRENGGKKQASTPRPSIEPESYLQPTQAKEKAEAVIGQVTELRVDVEKREYKTIGKDSGKMFGLFAVEFDVTATVHADTKEVEVAKPWWSFLVF